MSAYDGTSQSLMAIIGRFHQLQAERIQLERQLQERQIAQQHQQQQQQQLAAGTIPRIINHPQIPLNSMSQGYFPPTTGRYSPTTQLLNSLINNVQQQQQQQNYSNNTNNPPGPSVVPPPTAPAVASATASAVPQTSYTTPIQNYYASQLPNIICTCPCPCSIHDATIQQQQHSLLPTPTIRSLPASAFTSAPANPRQYMMPSGIPSSPNRIQPLLTHLADQNRAYFQNIQYAQQQRMMQNNLMNAAAVAAAATASSSSSQQQQSSQPSHSNNNSRSRESNNVRQKRPANFGTDGRPSSKVRRVLSMDGNAPSSSQTVSTDRLEIDPFQLPFTPSYRMCTNCQTQYSVTTLPSTVCPCHHSMTCNLSGSICQICYYNALSSEYSRNNARLNRNQQQVIDTRQTHQQRQREAATLFYQQNLYENPSPPGGGVLVVNNRAPYMDILFFAPGEATVTGISGLSSHVQGTPYSQQTTQQQIQTLHQVLSNAPHMTEPPPIGATPDQIKKNTTILSYIKDANVPEQETERCTVCLVDFETDDEVRTLNCNHIFHTECIDRWLTYNKKCPVCRLELDKPANYHTLSPDSLLREFIFTGSAN
jgi:hypothetical protein